MTIRHAARALAASALALALAAPADAQQQPPGAGRATLEGRLRERLGAIVQRRLELTDDQTAKLRQSSQKFERQRRDLMLDERQARQALRRHLADGGVAANQDSVAALIDRTLRVQRRRVELLESEQRELAGFLTPVQRAKFFALQEELRRRMTELRQRRGAQPAGPGARRRPPGG